MDLEKLFLKKEELPILYKNCFQIPIHPKLLDENIKIDESIAKKIFPQVAEEWYEDLKKYSELQNLEEKDHINQVYLDKKPKLTRELNRQYVNEIWEDLVQTHDNGLVTCFSINRNAGGSLYFNKGELNCRSFGSIYIKFSEEKRREFRFEEKHNQMHIYASHNIDYYPGALFLRNWAIKYMNEVFKQIFSK